MTSEYFSDREVGTKEKTIEYIPENVWNGIVSIYNKLISNNHLSANFPVECDDNYGTYACDTRNLEYSIKAEIPNIKTPIQPISSHNFTTEEEVIQTTYCILDFIEFLYKNITDVEKGSYHSFFQHHHLSFPKGKKNKKRYIKDINLLFDRNCIAYFLTKKGEIRRTIPGTIKEVVEGIRLKTDDPRLDELLEISYSKIILPKHIQRMEGLEKLWDAFERLKTYYDENNKKKSANTLIKNISNSNNLFEEHIGNEFMQLTKIGNAFQIRHFEKNKIQLTDNKHIDYLFYRMSCLIALSLKNL